VRKIRSYSHAVVSAKSDRYREEIKLRRLQSLNLERRIERLLQHVSLLDDISALVAGSDFTRIHVIFNIARKRGYSTLKLKSILEDAIKRVYKPRATVKEKDFVSLMTLLGGRTAGEVISRATGTVRPTTALRDRNPLGGFMPACHGAAELPLLLRQLPLVVSSR